MQELASTFGKGFTVTLCRDEEKEEFTVTVNKDEVYRGNSRKEAEIAYKQNTERHTGVKHWDRGEV